MKKHLAKILAITLCIATCLLCTISSVSASTDVNVEGDGGMHVDFKAVSQDFDTLRFGAVVFDTTTQLGVSPDFVKFWDDDTTSPITTNNVEILNPDLYFASEVNLKERYQYSDGRIFSYYSDATAINPSMTFVESSDLYGYVSLTCSDFIYDKDLAQGTIQVVLANDVESHPDDWDAWYDSVTYSGILSYPTLDGGIRYINFSYTSTLREVWNDNFTTNKHRVSIVPSVSHWNGNPEKINAYEHAYYELSEAERVGLLSPDKALEKSQGTTRITNYQVTYCVGYSLTTDTNNPVVYASQTSIFNPTRTFRVKDISIVLPATTNGSPRSGESTTSFYSRFLPGGTTKVELDDVNFASFIKTIFIGILGVQILPSFYLYHIVGTFIVVSLIIWLLKALAGG